MKPHPCKHPLDTALCRFHREPFRHYPRGIPEFIKTASAMLAVHTPFWTVDCLQDQANFDALLEKRPLCCRLADYNLLIPAYDFVGDACNNLWPGGVCDCCQMQSPCVFSVDIGGKSSMPLMGPTKAKPGLLCFLCYLGHKDRITWPQNDHPYQPSSN